MLSAAVFAMHVNFNVVIFTTLVQTDFMPLATDKTSLHLPNVTPLDPQYHSCISSSDLPQSQVNEDGLIYAEVGHTKMHPPDKPPIQTEESTEYASLDFGRMKTEEESKQDA